MRSGGKATLFVVPLAAWLAACGSESGVSPDETLAAYEPGEELPGGETTNTLLLGSNAFIKPAANATDENETLFFSGNSLFNQPWVQAPASTQSRDGLGPLFNARSCAACHFKDGRGRPPLEPDEAFLGLLLRLSIPGEGPNGAPVPDPAYGGQFQPFEILGVEAEGTPQVTYEAEAGTFPDGTPYELLHPTYTLSDLAYGPVHEELRMSPRVAPAMIGLGLLEAIEEARLLSFEDPDDADGDGISGRINRVWDVEAEQMAVGRFGWKAEQPSVRQQSAGAFLGDIGITTSLFPTGECTPVQTDCQTAISGGEPEIPDNLLLRVQVYSQLLAVPGRVSFQNDTVLRGKKLFTDVGCAACHIPRHETGVNPDLPEVSNQVIWPYTDLLLHDMGEDLADNRPTYGANGREWRTPPLWGLRLYQVVNRHDRLMHDGRARGVVEAILWHGGEAEASNDRFQNLDAVDRDALVAFVESL